MIFAKKSVSESGLPLLADGNGKAAAG